MATSYSVGFRQQTEKLEHNGHWECVLVLVMFFFLPIG